MSLLNTITTLYEDDHIVVIGKPAGLAVHPDGRTKEETLVDWINTNHPEMKGVGEPTTLTSGEMIDRPGIVHRIDRETSGALILTKDEKTFVYFKKLFKDREVKKIYHTFVYGSLPKEFDTIDRPIGRSRTDFRLWSAQSRARGEMRDAVTYYEVLRRGEKSTFVKVLPKTGRTHQIRVHFKAIHHPVVADDLYAPKGEKLLGFKRLALHARSLQFVSINGKELTIEAPYPEDFQTAVELIEKEASV